MLRNPSKPYYSPIKVDFQILSLIIVFINLYVEAEFLCEIENIRIKFYKRAERGLG